MIKRIQQIGHQKFAHLVDLDRPIVFTLNGRKLGAFFGDTLYSALVANNITEVTGPHGESLALNKSMPIFARHNATTSRQARILIADLVLHDGDVLELEMTPLSIWARFVRFLRGKSHAPLAINWHQNAHFDLQHANSLTQKTVIVGGGVSGMKAAIEAAQANQDVLLLEKDQMLGGICAYYGKSADETEPEELLNTLMGQVEAHDRIRVFTGSKALDIRDKSLLVQHSLFHEQGQRTELSWVSFDHLVIATGGDHHGFTLDNHLPYRVLDSKEAFHDLWAYGLVRFEQNLIYTLENGAHRFAMQLKEAGFDIIKAFDGRDNPNSRHIEFAKAVGVKLGFAVRLQSAAPLRTNIQSHFSPTHYDAQHQQFQIESQALIVGYPPQPDNTLWVKAGGTCAVDRRTDRILPNAGPAHIAIVGTAAGYSSQIDCLTSATEAMSQLGVRGLAQGAAQVHNSQVYESPAAYRQTLPHIISRKNSAFYDYPNATNYFLQALPLTDQTLRQYFANGYYADVEALPTLSPEIPTHFKDIISNGQHFEILPENEERMRAGQMLFVAGQEKTLGVIGIIVQVSGRRIEAYCDAEVATEGLNISVERRNGQNAPAHIGAPV